MFLLDLLDINEETNQGVTQKRIRSDPSSSIVESALRNPDAFRLLQRIKSTGRYRYSHAINCCALAATLYRHMGFNKTEIHDISMGALMLDIGITNLPDVLINTQGTLNPLSMQLVPAHVTFGMEILENTPDISLRCS